MQAPHGLPEHADGEKGPASIWWAISLAICHIAEANRAFWLHPPCSYNHRSPTALAREGAACWIRSLPHLPPGSLSHPSSDAATYHMGASVGSQRTDLRGRRWRALQDPQQLCSVLGKSPPSSVPPPQPAPSSMLSLLACFAATEPFTLYALLLPRWKTKTSITYFIPMFRLYREYSMYL